mmetsp:Transcript_36327/g.71489  ORF Transcript_36327/g.71489 Transcript_36327/m.71489 type:complete len:354 (-) Transcript_36327:175-1236(-)
MSEGSALISQNGGVRQISLKPGDGKFAAEEFQEGVGHASVAFGVFEVDGVHLMRHCGTSNLSLDRSQLQEVPGNVEPHVDIEIDQDREESGEGVTDLCDVVVLFDLRAVGLVHESQPALHKLGRQGGPVDLGVGSQVSVEVSHSAVELSHELYPLNVSDCVLKSVREVCHLFAKCCGGRRLAVCPREEGGLRVLLCQVDQSVYKFGHGRDETGDAILHHECVGEVVNVLRCAREVDVLSAFVQPLASLFFLLGEFFLDEIFDGLDVVICGCLNVLHPLRALDGDVAQGRQKCVLLLIQWQHLWQLVARRHHAHPLTLHPHSVFDQTVLREDRTEGCCLTAVASINGGDGSERA